MTGAVEEEIVKMGLNGYTNTIAGDTYVRTRRMASWPFVACEWRSPGVRQRRILGLVE